MLNTEWVFSSGLEQLIMKHQSEEYVNDSAETLLHLSLKHFLEKLHYPPFTEESKFWKVVLNSPRSSIVQLCHSDLILMLFIKSSKLCLQRTLCCLFNQDKENRHSLQERLLWEEAKMNTTCQGGCIQTPWSADLHPKNQFLRCPKSLSHQRAGHKQTGGLVRVFNEITDCQLLSGSSNDKLVSSRFSDLSFRVS